MEKRAVCISCYNFYEHRVELVLERLRALGYACTYITGDYSHFTRQEYHIDYPDSEQVPTLRYRRNVSPQRIRSHLKFSRDVFRRVEQLGPELVYVMVPPNSLSREAAAYKKRHPDTRLILDIYDLWPESFPSDKIKRLAALPFALWGRFRDVGLQSADIVYTECRLFAQVLGKRLAGKDVRLLPLCRERATTADPVAPAGEELGLCYLGSIGKLLDIDALTALIREAVRLRPVALHIVGEGETREQLIAAAREAGLWLSIGVSERVAESGTLYNTNLIFAPDGRLAARHRKLKPTGAERVVWGDADRGFFPVAETPWGPMGSLICWESYMPLARVALYEKGVTLYLSPNTNDNEEWQATIRHIAIEGHCYFINCDMVFERSQYPADLNAQEEIARLPETVCRGDSCVVDPYGHYVTEPVWDREAVIYADLDMNAVPASRMEFDACGHYSRPDVLRLEYQDR